MELKGEGVLNLDLVKCLKCNPFHYSIKSPPLPLPCGILSGIKWSLSLQTSGAPQSPAPTQSKKTAIFLQHFCHIWQETSVLCMWQAALMGCTQKTSLFLPLHEKWSKAFLTSEWTHRDLSFCSLLKKSFTITSGVQAVFLHLAEIWPVGVKLRMKEKQGVGFVLVVWRNSYTIWFQEEK